jgi:glycosyltransferase involved in cell wall biosynthesis
MDPTEVAFAWPRPYVAWVGNLKARKRPELCPDIARALAPHGIDLVVAGPAQDERYRWLTRPVSGVSNLHHVGQLTPAEVTGLLAGARALAVTSMPEGFSNVMIQAWWGATPTVTLEYDPDGLVAAEGLGAVADGDVERFLAETVRIARDEDGAGSAAGGRAARLAREQFAEAPILDRLEALLAEVAEVERA